MTLAPRLRKTSDHPNESQVVGQARPNVFYEAGMAMSLFRDKTVFVQVGVVKAFSDIGGTHITRLSNSATSRQELATKLKNTGLAVDTDGTDWLTDGDFDRKELNALTHKLTA
ncbi:MAG: nucleotide-binding protein [Chloroflexi bacterium]|nr:nucleotide-binding protein [Chloroflexota bacterium]